MSSVSEILARLNFSRRDLNNLSTSQLETIFSDLTSKEIALLCRTNRKFNTLCEDESYWETRVLNRHGITKKYGSTWRETAKNMDEINMIDLNVKWIDGRIFKEILNDTLQNGASTLKDLPKQYLLPYVNDDGYDVKFMRDEDPDENGLQYYAETFLDRSYTNGEIDDILLINTSEINVIYSAVLAYEGKKGYLPGVTKDNIIAASRTYEFLRELIDPMIYVMQFSSFTHEQLSLA